MPNVRSVPIEHVTGDAAPGGTPLSARRLNVVVASVLLGTAAAVGIANVWAVLNGQWVGVALYEHGYPVAALALWLIWRAFRSNPPATVAPNWYWAPLFAAAVVLLVLLDLLFLNVPRVLLIPPLVVTSTGFVFGNAVAMRVLWPMVLLYSAMPVWVPLTSVLQSLTTAVVSSALASTGVPAFIEGNFVHLPSGTFEIAEDCSGLRFVVIATTLLFFYGLAFLPTWRARLTSLAVAVASAIVCNWIRVYVIVVAGHLTNMQHYLVKVEHITFGWLLFAVFLVPPLWFARRFEEIPARESSPVRPPLVGPGIVTAACVAAAILLVPQLAAIAEQRIGTHAAPTSDVAADSAPVREFAWQPVFANALEAREIHDVAGEPVELFIARYPRQDPDHRLIAYGNKFTPNGWQAVQQHRVAAVAGGATFDVLELEGHLGSSRRVMWAWYSVAGATATGPLEAKLLELEGLFAGRRDAVAFVMAAECDVDCDAARRRLAAFLQQAPNFLQTRATDSSTQKDLPSTSSRLAAGVVVSGPNRIRRES